MKNLRYADDTALMAENEGKNSNLNRSVTSSEFEFVITKKNCSRQNSGMDSFTGEIYQTCKEELIPILLKLLKKKQN